MEELAKVGGTTLESEKILKIISPFVREMAENDDQRLLDEIQERIFYHLMKQSDTGIDYIESRGGTLELMVRMTYSTIFCKFKIKQMSFLVGIAGIRHG